MKIGFLLRLSVLIILLSGSCFTISNAQIDAGSFMQGGVQDARSLLNAYLAPFGETFGINMNSGWYNTGQPLKPGRFELRVNVPLSMAGEERQYYNISQLGLSSGWQYERDQQSTMFGPDGDQGTLRKTIGSGSSSYTIEMPLPPGLGYAFSPIPPSVQFSLGLFKGTELIGRFIPKRSFSIPDYGDANINSWGLGVKHSIKQWIPVLNKIPFDLSVLAAYSKMNMGYDLESSILPVTREQSSRAINSDGSAYSESTYRDQGMAFNTSAWNVNLIISKKLSIFTPYAGIRYGNSSSNLTMTGVYGYVDRIDNAQRIVVENLDKDEFSLNMPFTQVSANAGFRLKLAIMTLYGEANFGKYTTYTAGIGLGWMN
jgi:hypothetical protein